MTQPVNAESDFHVKSPGEPIFNDHDPEPKDIKDVVAAPGRVLATALYWSGGYTYRTVYFSDDVTTLNEMIASLRNVKNRNVRIIIRDDYTETRKMLLQRTLENAPAFDWSIRINSRIKIGGPDSGSLMNVDVFMDIWPSDRIPMDQLKIPSDFCLEAVSRIEKFVDFHESARLGSREAMLRKRIRDLQDKLARVSSSRVTTKPAEPSTKPATESAKLAR